MRRCRFRCWLGGHSGLPYQPGAAPVVVVSRAFADAEWPSQNPVGKEFRIVGFEGRVRVAGVVGDIRHSGLREEQGRAVYASNRQNPGIFMTLAVRFAMDPEASSDALRRAVWQVDSDQQVWKVRTLDSLVDRSIQLERFLIGVLGIFGAAALLLAVTGLSGVVAQSVQQRAKEIGVRVARRRHAVSGGATRRAFRVVDDGDWSRARPSGRSATPPDSCGRCFTRWRRSIW